MAGIFWNRFNYPTCPDDLNEHQKLKKYQILQYSQQDNSTKKSRYKHIISNNKHIRTNNLIICSGYNPPTASNVPGNTWDLTVTDSMIQQKSIIQNEKHKHTKSGPSTWEHSNTT